MMEAIPNGKINMIKWVRETTKCTLREALDRVSIDLQVHNTKRYIDLTIDDCLVFMNAVRNIKTDERLSIETHELMATVRRFNARWNTEWTLVHVDPI